MVQRDFSGSNLQVREDEDEMRELLGGASLRFLKAMGTLCALTILKSGLGGQVWCRFLRPGRDTFLVLSSGYHHTSPHLSGCLVARSG